MATQRYISTSFWDDEWIQTLDPSEKLLYLYLMTNPLTNIAGVYKITVRRMCFDTGFNADTVGHILGKFEKVGKAYLHDEYIVLPSWPQHQKADTRSKIKEGIDAIIKTLPDDMVTYMVSIGYRYHIKGYTYPPNYSDIDSDSESKSETDSKDTPQAATIEPFAVAVPEKDPLYDSIKAAFEKVHGDFSNYAKEGQAIKRIIKLTKGDKVAIEAMIKTFFTLRRKNDIYWSRMPFTPSRLSSSGVWDGVLEEARRTLAAKDTAWIEQMEREAVTA